MRFCEFFKMGLDFFGVIEYNIIVIYNKCSRLWGQALCNGVP